MHGVREAYRGVNFSHGLQPMSAIRYPPKVRYSEPVSWSMEVGVNWLRKVLPLPIPRLDDHVSIWSVTARDARTFFRIAGSLWLVAFAFIVYQKLAGQTPLPTDPNLAERRRVSPRRLRRSRHGRPRNAIVSMLLTRAVNTTGEVLMSLYQAMVNRFVIPVIEKHEARGRAEGLEQGRAESRAEWRAWNERRLAAERDGREFTESPPAGQRSEA